MPKARKQRYQKWMALLLALLLAAVLAPAAFAASERVQAVLDRLGTLRGANIEPWYGDVSHNEGLVQEMLDMYVACAPEERAEFTPAQLDDLRAYFTVLYEVQGKNPADLNTLFESTPPPASSPPISSAAAASAPSSIASSAVSEAPAASSVPPPSSAVSAVPPPASQPASGGGMPGGGQPPQLPGDDGWLGLFGNAALGSVLLVILLALAVALFIHFLSALRRTDKIPSAASPEDVLRARELFGENYDEETVERRALQPPERFPAHPEKLSDSPKTAAPAERGTAQAGNEAPPDFKPETAPSLENASGGSAENAFFRRGKADAPESELTEKTAEAATPDPVAIDIDTDLNLPEKTARPRARTPEPAPLSDIGHNPDRPNSITMRSFSGQPRTGHPPKMTFRQGDPSDLDAIDE